MVPGDVLVEIWVRWADFVGLVAPARWWQRVDLGLVLPATRVERVAPTPPPGWPLPCPLAC